MCRDAGELIQRQAWTNYRWDTPTLPADLGVSAGSFGRDTSCNGVLAKLESRTYIPTPLQRCHAACYYHDL